MKKFQIVEDYVIFEELGTDSLGSGYRAAQLEGQKPTAHKLLTEVQPFLLEEPSAWAKTQILLDTIARAGIPKLYAPEKIIDKEDRAFLVYPYIEGKTLGQVFEESARQKKPLPFDLAFSIAISLANLIDLGCTVDFGRETLFHGFLTPDHIIIGYNGKIFVKYFGVWPFIDKSDNIISRTTQKYGAWLAPEFIKGEEIVRQTDIYHLGYLVYRMLTGRYFSYLPGEGFERTITSISFSYDIPSTDKEFLTNLINFFRKTLNPDIRRRFRTTEELRTYIKEHFRIEDNSSFASNLASLMYALYQETMKEEKQQLSEELWLTIPDKTADDVSEKIVAPVEFEQKKTPRSKYLFMAAVVIVLGAVGFAVVQYVANLDRKKQEVTAVREMETKIAQLDGFYQKKIEELKVSYEKKFAEDESKRAAQTKERDQLIEKIQRQKQREIEDIKQDLRARGVKLDVEEKPQPDRVKVRESKPETPSSSDTSPKVVPEKKPSSVPEKRQERETADRTPVKRIVEIPLAEVSRPPQKISGEEAKFSPSVSRNYPGKRGTAQASILVDENGDVESVKMLSRLPQDIEAVLEDTLRQWKYRPALKDNNRVKVWLPVEMKFSFRHVESTDQAEKELDQAPEKAAEPIRTVKLQEVSEKPVKISGSPPAFPRAIKETYAGRRATVHAEVLIDEKGVVTDVRILTKIPGDIQAVIVDTLKTWRYKPAVKGNLNVRVWQPLSLKISFK